MESSFLWTSKNRKVRAVEQLNIVRNVVVVTGRYTVWQWLCVGFFSTSHFYESLITRAVTCFTFLWRVNSWICRLEYVWMGESHDVKFKSSRNVYIENHGSAAQKLHGLQGLLICLPTFPSPRLTEKQAEAFLKNMTLKCAHTFHPPPQQPPLPS